MKTIAIGLTALAAYITLQLHQLGHGLAGLARYAAFRLVDLVIELTRLAAFVALALAIWYLIDPTSATARLSALWHALRATT